MVADTEHTKPPKNYMYGDIYGGKCTYVKDPVDCAVNSPSHYNRKGVECIQAIEASMSEEEFLGYLRGNILKYQWRCRYKGHTVQDIEKSIWYANKLKEKLVEYGKA